MWVNFLTFSSMPFFFLTLYFRLVIHGLHFLRVHACLQCYGFHVCLKMTCLVRTWQHCNSAVKYISPIQLNTNKWESIFQDVGESERREFRLLSLVWMSIPCWAC
jgi:hypothetical protein